VVAPGPGLFSFRAEQPLQAPLIRGRQLVGSKGFSIDATSHFNNCRGIEPAQEERLYSYELLVIKLLSDFTVRGLGETGHTIDENS
jgi:hypothetical protein